MPAPADKAGVQTVGTCTVPQQVLAKPVRLHKTIKRTNAERCRVGVGLCTANINGSSENQSQAHQSSVTKTSKRR